MPNQGYCVAETGDQTDKVDLQWSSIVGSQLFTTQRSNDSAEKRGSVEGKEG